MTSRKVRSGLVRVKLMVSGPETLMPLTSVALPATKASAPWMPS